MQLYRENIDIWYTVMYAYFDEFAEKENDLRSL